MKIIPTTAINPSVDQILFAEALLSSAHNILAVLEEFSEDDQDKAIDFATLTAGALRQFEGYKILPTDAITRYLDSGDTLTDHSIDQMELAMEKAAGVKSPAYITSFRQGTEKDDNLSVEYFYLDFES